MSAGALVVELLSEAVVGYFLLVNGIYLFLLLASILEMRAHILQVRIDLRERLLGSRVAPTISILAPAYNESATIRESLRTLLSLRYPNLEVIVVNDGSRDSTMDVVRDSFDLYTIHPIYRRRIETRAIRGLYTSARYPSLIVVDKENGGKADALNAALNQATGDLVCAIDSDTLIEPDALLRMVRPFLYGNDVVAVGGTISVVNDAEIENGRVVQGVVPRAPLPGIQIVEYLRAFLIGRLGWNRLGGNLIISGAFGLFRRDAVIRAGGYLHDTVGEDMELVIRLRRLAYEQGAPGRVEFLPDPVAWTEVPETARVLGRQRDRWHRGLADVLWRHRDVAFRPRYGTMGMIGFPYFLLVELLAPVLEAVGLVSVTLGIALGWVSWQTTVLFFLIAYGFGALFGILAILVEEVSFAQYRRPGDVTRLILLSLVENLGYRQLTVYWRLRGLVGFFRGQKGWGAMERRGFQPARAPAKVP